jgi:predicted anti-sigma-YlaC factor YlaD
VLARASVPSPGRGEWVRYALGVVAGTNLLLGLPGLLLGTGADAPVHVARHLGAFVVAVSLGLLFCAWRPERSAGLLPLATALVVTMTAGAIADVASGNRPAVAEVVHVLELTGLVLLWLLAGRPWPRSFRRAGTTRAAQV